MANFFERLIDSIVGFVTGGKHTASSAGKAISDAYNKADKQLGEFTDNATKKIGEWVNNATGVTASQNFNKEMASTEYQRAVDDLEKAGLNPSVMYGGGSVGHSASSSGSGGAGIYNVIGGNINALIHAATELHEDAHGKNKNVAFHTANEMVQKAWKEEIKEWRKSKQ